MKNKLLISFFFLMSGSECFCQDKSTLNLAFASQENLEYSALKSLFYLIRQDYVAFSRKDEKLTRGGNDYFGKAYTIGIITANRKLLFPGFVRSPWMEDSNFNEYKDLYKPECTNTKIRALDDSVYHVYNLKNLESAGPVSGFIFGHDGIKISDSISDKGCLVIFHTSRQIPDKNEKIQYSIANIDYAEWNNQGIYALKEPYLGSNQQIIGGVFFSRIVSVAKIDWKLSGMYVKIHNAWVIQSIIAQNDQRQ
jgi:hypothetical protein